jgi:hypothetical protein
MPHGRLRMILVSVFLWLAPMTLDAPAKASAPAASGEPVAVIPFELYHKRIYLPVGINDLRDQVEARVP